MGKKKLAHKGITNTRISQARDFRLLFADGFSMQARFILNLRPACRVLSHRLFFFRSPALWREFFGVQTLEVF
jgi:hypothetical protein